MITGQHTSELRLRCREWRKKQLEVGHSVHLEIWPIVAWLLHARQVPASAWLKGLVLLERLLA